MKGFTSACMPWRAAVLALFLVFSVAGLAEESPMPLEGGADAARIHINRADARTIAEGLDGIGERRAEAIVAYREANGEYRSVEDLAKVKGVGEMTLERNRDKIRFD